MYRHRSMRRDPDHRRQQLFYLFMHLYQISESHIERHEGNGEDGSILFKQKIHNFWPS
jgi:hypothetical protein